MLTEVSTKTPRTVFDVSNYYTVVLCIVYLTIGSVSILFNIFNIYVFGRRKSLRKKYIVIIFLEAAEIMNGIAYIMTGLGRLNGIVNSSLRTPITVEECFFTKPWPALILVGTQLPALVVIFASVERTVAVHQPSSYYRHWNYVYKLKRLFLLLVVQMVSIFIAARTSFGIHTLNPSQHCPVISSTHIAYCTAHFLFVVLAYVISFSTLLSIFRSRQSYSQVNSTTLRRCSRRESNLRVFMMTSLMCIVFMSIPALASLLIRWNIVEGNEIVLGISLVPPGLISIGTTMVNCIFHCEYRSNVLRIFYSTSKEKPTVARSIDGSEVFPEKLSPLARSFIMSRERSFSRPFQLMNNSEMML
ncbi:hypothetical protein GCK32_009695 [Trichostrongylus colubriformis]|uniref:G-protein coupled receptors family 1 profile domain-containing protein n=1 Tax=Trichostrongylus colubriformis TaxID=6319 RepID=A0AAN8FRX8_TRICO